VAEPHWTTRLGRQIGHPAPMIAMFVGHQEGIQVFRRQAKAGQTPRRFARAETAIHHDRGPAGLHHPGIAFATTAQAGEAKIGHYFNCS